jgi:hypothetical protein
MEPASKSEFPVNRFGGNGHIELAGAVRNDKLKNTNKVRFRRRNPTE